MSLFDTMRLSATPAPTGFMKAVTVWQPHATLIWLLLKEYETRGWPTRYRGPIAIHAASRVMRRGDIIPDMEKALAPFISENVLDFDAWPYGAILGIFDLVDCIKTEKVIISIRERVFGNYYPGRYAWKLKPIQVFDKPIPFKGAQGLWNLPLSVLQKKEILQ